MLASPFLHGHIQNKGTKRSPPKDERAVKNITESKVVFRVLSTKICTLEEWNETPPPQYASVGETSTFSPEILKAVDEYIDSCNAELRELSIKIHGKCKSSPGVPRHVSQRVPRLMISVQIIQKRCSKRDMPIKNRWRTIGFNSEMDALPEIGHACGHNLIAMGGVAAALGTKYAMEKCGIEGRVVLLGTPAEEAGNGKIILIKRGAYKEMDACLMMHPTPGPKLSAGTGSSLAIQPIEVEYFGPSVAFYSHFEIATDQLIVHLYRAHASGAPWEGQNALDAAFLAYSSISVLRQQMKVDPYASCSWDRGGTGLAPNIIPDYAKMRWLVRAPTAKEVEVFAERVKKCFEAAALATSCQIKLVEHPLVTIFGRTTNWRQNLQAVMKHYGGVVIADVPGAAGGSTDFGNVTYGMAS
ncbi:hypothetical protein BS47DRAFT_1365657 [Hydnum rufescens UP504]|uniref:Peptidase M20 dimerisation domain-containing protein n=1 Tax=Hydnum rufescens UP504 TaxID=1448309 RepID=A0A9P6DNB6_9AGAM|nr:hypothetical protein BS47DRAFT_1365657 [Hydnum rufescens UP504]